MNPVDVARRFVDVREHAGSEDNPYIQAWLADAGFRKAHDEVPWCGAFARFVVGRVLGLPVPILPARARSWLLAGVPVTLDMARPGDVVVFSRGGTEPQPGPDVLDAPGHVTFFVGPGAPGFVRVIGGNQNNRVSEQAYPRSRVLGVRRVA